MSVERVDARRQSVWCISVGGWCMSPRYWREAGRPQPFSLRANCPWLMGIGMDHSRSIRERHPDICASLPLNSTLS